MSFYPENIIPFIILFLIVISLIYFLWGRERKLPLFFRIITTILLLTFLFEPILRFVISSPPTLQVLVDSSKSMQEENKRKMVEKTLSRIRSLKLKTDILGFDTQIHPLGKNLGNGTAIGNALQEIGKNSGGILLISDGLFNTGKDPIQVASEIGIPIYVLGVGDTSKTENICITDIERNYNVYKGDSVPVKISIENSGVSRIPTELILREGKKILKKEKITLLPNKAKKSWLTYITPQEPGIHIYEVSIPTIQNEPPEDNRMKFSINVLKKRLNILYISSRPTFNFKFFKKSLESSKNISVSSLINTAQNKWLKNDTIVRSTSSNLSSYDLVIAEEIGSPEIERYIESGGSVISIGKSLGEMSPFIFGKSRVEGEFNIKFSDPGLAALFQNFPPLNEIEDVLGVKRGAKILGVIRETARGEQPFIADMNYGKGEILGIASENLWRIPFVLGEDGDKFWLNLIKWFVKRRDTDRLWVETKGLYKAGEEISFKGEIREEIKNAEIKVNVFGPDTETIFLFPSGENRYEGSVDYLTPGKYRWVAVAKANEKVIGRKESNFSIEKPMIEVKNPYMNKKILNRIALVSNGEYGEKMSELHIHPENVKRPLDLRLTLNPLFLLLMIGLLSLEWVLLRR